MRHLLIGAALVALCVPASAADMAPSYPVKAAPVVVELPFSWTGFYLGANAGGAWSDGQGTAAIAPYGFGPLSGSGETFIYGGQIGYNYQIGSWVVGAETDLQGTTSKGSLNGFAGSTPYTSDAEVDYFGTIRARVGYSWDRLLIYGTAGAVYGKNSIDGVIGGTVFSASDTYWTYTVGGGAEYALTDNWSLKGEYLYIGTPDGLATPPGTSNLSGSLNTNIVRAGVNYRF